MGGRLEVKIVFLGEFREEWQGLLRECDMVQFAFCGIERQDTEGSLLCKSHCRRENGRRTDEKSEKGTNYRLTDQKIE